MTDQEQIVKVKCPRCGWVRSIPVRALKLGETEVTLGLKEVVEKLRALFADHELDEANAWIDLPPCPQCRNTYQYNVRTRECRR
jgi:predicted RNA-binding Zn-ribbon protein involved in translation (DUF1610 family)